MKKYLVAVFEVDEESLNRLKEELIINYKKDVYLPKSNYKIDETEDYIKKLLNYFKISSKYKGYKYIIDAVKLIRDKKITKTCDIYKEVAKMNFTTYNSVERTIRTITKTICNSNKKEDIEQKLRLRFNVLTNSDFLYALADLSNN